MDLHERLQRGMATLRRNNDLAYRALVTGLLDGTVDPSDAEQTQEIGDLLLRLGLRVDHLEADLAVLMQRRFYEREIQQALDEHDEKAVEKARQRFVTLRGEGHRECPCPLCAKAADALSAATRPKERAARLTWDLDVLVSKNPRLFDPPAPAAPESQEAPVDATTLEVCDA